MNPRRRVAPREPSAACAPGGGRAETEIPSATPGRSRDRNGSHACTVHKGFIHPMPTAGMSGRENGLRSDSNI